MNLFVSSLRKPKKLVIYDFEKMSLNDVYEKVYRFYLEVFNLSDEIVLTKDYHSGAPLKVKKRSFKDKDISQLIFKIYDGLDINKKKCPTLDSFYRLISGYQKSYVDKRREDIDSRFNLIIDNLSYEQKEEFINLFSALKSLKILTM